MAELPCPADPQSDRANQDRSASMSLAPRCIPNDDATIPDTLCDPVRHVVAWQAHVDAGRIGNRIAVSPEIAANRDRWTALARTMRR